MKYTSTIILLFILLTVGTIMNAQSIRPVRDNVGFCWTPEQMDILMEYLQENEVGNQFDAQGLVAGISPHDDYLYAGRVYYPLYQMLRAKEVVVFGVTHGTVRRAMDDPQDKLIFDTYDQWQGPYRDIEISDLRKFITDRLPPDEMMVSNKAQDIEHSIEALVPFLQYYNRDFNLTPIMVTGMSFDRMEQVSDGLSKILDEYIQQNSLTPGKDIFFLISSDLNHYGEDFDNAPYGKDSAAHAEGSASDQKIARTAFDGELTSEKIKDLTEILWNIETSDSIAHPLWCGQYSIPFGLLTIMKTLRAVSDKSLSGKILRYSDTWTEGVLPIERTSLGTTAPFSLEHWVGFLSAGFYLE